MINNIDLNDINSWEKIDIYDKIETNNNNNNNDKLIRLKIGLLGNIQRRQRSERYLNLLVSDNIKHSLVSVNKLPNTFITKEIL
jgi:hypothetical protein